MSDDGSDGSNMSLKESIVVIALHLIIPLIFWGGMTVYQHYFPKTQEELALEKDPNRKIYFEKFDKEEYNHPELNEKISRLDSAKQSLNEILYFIDYQKKSLETQNKNLEELVKQNAELEPIVNTKKELIDAIFKVQETRNAIDKRNDQIIGFIFGVVSSLVASIIIFLWNRFVRRRTIS